METALIVEEYSKTYHMKKWIKIFSMQEYHLQILWRLKKLQKIKNVDEVKLCFSRSMQYSFEMTIFAARSNK